MPSRLTLRPVNNSYLRRYPPEAIYGLTKAERLRTPKSKTECSMIMEFNISISERWPPKHPNLMKGTKELLFAVVKDNDFYALGIFDHKAWSKQALLDIVKANWPHLIKPYELVGNTLKPMGLSRTYTDAGAATLRKHGINALTEGPDGSIRMGPGGGVTTDGGSLSVSRELIKIERYVERLSKRCMMKCRVTEPRRMPRFVSSGAAYTFCSYNPGRRGDQF